MISPLKVGETIKNPVIPGDLVIVQAIALKWGVLDIAVIVAKSVISGYVVFEHGKTDTSPQLAQIWAEAEEAVGDYLNRAFGISY